MAVKKTKLECPEDMAPIEILDEGEDLERLFTTFEVNDDHDIESIMNGSMGEDFE